MNNINLREAAPTSSPIIAHSAWMHGTLWNAIFTSLTGYEIDVIDTLRFNNDANFLYRLATALGMRPNHEYWCKCTWQTNGINKTATSDRLDLPKSVDSWASSDIGEVTSLFSSHETVSQCDHLFCCYMCICCLKLHRTDYQVEYFFIWAVYCSLGRRGYFGVSNVALLYTDHWVRYPLCALLIWNQAISFPRNMFNVKSIAYHMRYMRCLAYLNSILQIKNLSLNLTLSNQSTIFT